MMARTLLPLLLGALAVACGGGGGGGGGGPPPPPPPPFAVTSSTNLAIAAAFRDAAVLGGVAVVAASEAEAGADLNGDGDQTDAVAHAVNTAAGTVVNLSLAIAGAIYASDSQFLILVSENGEGADINGDGDQSDFVWHLVLDPGGQSPVLVNTMVATASTSLAAAGTTGGFVMMQSEFASANTDLNQDGDTVDTVVRAIDGNTLLVTPLILGPMAPGRPLLGRNGRVLFAADETALGPVGSDLNGDGDQTDVVLGAIDFTVGTPVFVNIGRAVALHPYALTDGAAAYFIDEATANGADLNLDGDTTDAILAVFDFAGGVGEILPTTPSVPSFALAGTVSLGIGAGPNRIIVGVDETANGVRDLNTDGDTSDSIVGWVDTAAAAQLHLMGLPFGLKPPVIDGVRGLVAISEVGIGFGGADLNADTDVNDDVVHVLDTSSAPGTLTSLGFAVSAMCQSGDDAILSISEAEDRGIDLNGDSVANDTVLRYLELSSGRSRNLAVVSGTYTFFRHPDGDVRIAALLPEGQSPTLDDINADGDNTDIVLELISIDPATPTPSLIAPTPFFAGTAAISAAPLRAGDNVFVFPTFEPMDGRDLSGDSDLLDTVLRFVTYATNG